MATCGEVLVRLLEAYGVEVVFGIPGVHTVELYRGLPATRIRHVTPRHEQGAGFMADGYARVSGRPGVCFIITGPGMTNILTAMGQAFADSVPMLVISSVNRTEQLGMGQGRLHELPSQRNVVAGVAGFSHTLLRAEQLPEVLARAFALFASARPRPVHIEIPIDVITSEAGHLALEPRPLPGPPGPAPDAIARAAELLRAAKRPLVVLGGGAVDAGEEARRLVERLDAPFVNTVNAKGVLPPGHPLHAGENMAFAPIREALRQADVVVAVGTEFGETEMYPDPQPLAFDGRLIRIDIDPEQLVRGFAADVPILSDARLALAALNAALGTQRRDGSGAATRGRDPRGGPQALVARGRGARARPGRGGAGARRSDHRRRPDAAGLWRQSVLRAVAAALLVQLEHRLRHAGLRAAGRDRGEARGAGAAGRGADRRRRPAVHACRSSPPRSRRRCR